MSQTESRGESWAKILVPVIIPMLVAGCIFLGRTAWVQSSKISDLESKAQSTNLVIEKYEVNFQDIKKDIQQINLDINTLKTQSAIAESTQNKIILILDGLDATLTNLNVTVGKLETRLDYSERGGK